MTDKHYVEHIEVTVDKDGWASHDVYWAVSPTGDQYFNEKGEQNFPWPMVGPWTVQGTTLEIYSIAQLNGVRKVLDLIEVELQQDEDEVKAFDEAHAGK